ncbi:MAG: MinD/ParA family protein [Desulfobacteraceae bacterium]|nr:MAG: MinD/ParA family protein [Desulfobacteraceae bacterium]
MARVIVFTSPLKGVGKTALSVNLAIELGRLGRSTCLFNTDSGAAAIDGLLDVHPRHHLADLIGNRVRLEDVIVRGAFGIDYFPGYPGIEALGSLDREACSHLHRSFLYFNQYDFFILDTFPGLSRSVAAMCKSTSEVVLVMNSDTEALTNAYLLSKLLSINQFEGTVMVLINLSRDLKLARRAYYRFKEAVSRYLPISATPLGTVFCDSMVEEAEKAGKPFVVTHPDCEASKCIVNIARHLLEKKTDDLAVSVFWSRYMDNLKLPFQIVGEPLKLFPKKIPVAHALIDSADDPPAGDAREGAREGARKSETEPAAEPALLPIEADGSDGRIFDTLAKLERQMASLSEDVCEIKQKLKDVGKSVSEPRRKPDPPIEPERLVLDFAAFLEQRKKEGKKGG